MSPMWYLLSSAFQRQVPFFVVCTWAHPLVYPLPLALRLARRPRVAVVASVALAALFDPSGAHALERLPLVTSLMLACPREVREMRASFLWLGLHAFSLAVSPTMKALWLGEGSGNANFLLNQHLIFSVASGAVVAEFVGASLRAGRREREEGARKKSEFRSPPNPRHGHAQD